MNEKESSKARILTFRDLWEIFTARWWVMLLAAVIAIAAVFIIRSIIFVPKYDSTATLYILRSEHQSTGSSTDSDFSLALKVVNDCDYLLKSHAVVDDVIDELQLDTVYGISYKELSEMISTSNPENTRILEVTVEAESPELAQLIVNSLCRIGQDKINDAMRMQQVNLFEEGTLSAEASNRMGIATYFLIGVIAAAAVYIIFLIMFVIDDSLRTEDDIVRALGLTVLAEIPDAGEYKKPNKYGRYGKYGRDGKYGRYGKATSAYGNKPYGVNGSQQGGRNN